MFSYECPVPLKAFITTSKNPYRTIPRPLEKIGSIIQRKLAIYKKSLNYLSLIYGANDIVRMPWIESLQIIPDERLAALKMQIETPDLVQMSKFIGCLEFNKKLVSRPVFIIQGKNNTLFKIQDDQVLND